ncbi:DUF7010 family protein [Paenibacillus xylaniclasticus]|uniref:DUF7010 family protein n=1 Tax=Paenibacillus xylaniclasticus TaxID=588083 RepID=UPI000FD74A47|nr:MULTISPECIES: hypothetical protein [Paenibacillus]GFN30818.1 hypothetical protein PCURB6_10780 [Paenibacillus curdlanolyticus]
MNYANMTLSELKHQLIGEAKKGYPFFVAGILFWLVMGGLQFVISSQKQLALCYIIGMGSIFPIAIAIGQLLQVNLLSKNPLGTLGGIIGGIQAFFLPVWIIVYLERPELVPMTVGVLVASHFLPYAWIYQSKTYLLFTIAMAALSVVFGYVLNDLAFTVLPFVLAGVYLITVIGLLMETKKFNRTMVNVIEHSSVS